MHGTRVPIARVKNSVETSCTDTVHKKGHKILLSGKITSSNCKVDIRMYVNGKILLVYDNHTKTVTHVRAPAGQKCWKLKQPEVD